MMAMRRCVLILPGLLQEGDEHSPLRQRLPAFETMVELGRLARLTPNRDVECPEALWLGLGPASAQMRQGPLTVSALGADPPDRSLHFHLSMLSLEEGTLTAPGFELREEDRRALFSKVWKLQSRVLTVLEGSGLEHGLVWEALGDLRTTSPSSASGEPYRSHLPEGDGEGVLRRFIDDSVNLLAEHPVNERRADEGLPPVNVLWPWGHGVRLPVPNLALRRGEPALVLSGSLRLSGLARLAGYRHGDRSAFGRLLNVRLEAVLEAVREEPLTIVVVESFAGLPVPERLEERHWLAREIEARLLAPLLGDAWAQPTRMAVIATGPGRGLSLEFETGNHGSGGYPFDERSLEERALPTADLWEVVEQATLPLPRLDSPRTESPPEPDGLRPETQ
jgi:hypothetical protein